DSELVDEIVADVREKLYPTGTIGFYSRFLGIENLLCKQSHDIYRLVVWGTPGVGKTTIAQTAFNLMSQDFEVHCFLEDFHFGMDELELPSGLFKTDCKPTGKKKVNNYFNLRWIEVIKSALEDEDLTMLSASQFCQIYSSSSEPSQELYLPKGLESLPYELKLLLCQLQYLWTGTKSLAKLKIINLSHSQKLVEVDELSKACSLKEIVLKGCTTLERTPRIDQLKTLELLDLSCCTRIKRNDVTDMIKPLDTGGLREIESGSMVFSTQGKTSDNTEKF
uniref:NB-ARC domain-containing protein n=1 Tax=Brassica oleracea var. oleracea TaxID=109376 RepID=A0A0D3D956_BRAOL